MISEFLSSTDLFRGLNNEELSDICGKVDTLKLQSGHKLISVGDESDNIYIIKKGKCKISIPFNFDLGENVLAFLNTGDCFGEMGVVTGEKRSANVSTSEDSEFIIIDKASFWEITEKYQIVYKNIINILSRRLANQNEGKTSKKRPPLNLSSDQKSTLKDFSSLMSAHEEKLVKGSIDASLSERKVKANHPSAFSLNNYFRTRSFFNVLTKPYLSEIEGLENIPQGKPVIFVLNYRTYFDFFFFLKLYEHLSKDRLLTIAAHITPTLSKYHFLLRPLLSTLFFSYLRRREDDEHHGTEDVINMIKRLESTGKQVDVVLHPTLMRSMSHDMALEYEHLDIWHKTGEARDIIPVAITGSDKFWPFEPWERKFFKISAFFNFNSVEIKIGKPISLKEDGISEKLSHCGQNKKAIKELFDNTNKLIGSEMAALEGLSHTPVSHGIKGGMLPDYNEKWSRRLGQMLSSGLSLRKKAGKSSIKIRHFVWHGEMLNVLLDHLEEEEQLLLPTWAKGLLISGASHADMEIPFLSMDHSYNPFNKKGMKLFVRFPDLMTTIKKEMEMLFSHIEKGKSFEKTLLRLGKIYHFMSDLAVPAHVHNIPHMFIDLPKVGKCDFEEFLGLDEQLIALTEHEIGDISSNKVDSFEDFYKGLDQIATHTFFSSAYDFERLKELARERMIRNIKNEEDLLSKLKRMGVSVLPVEGYEEEKLYYVRNLTTGQCRKISKEATFYALKMIAACFLFLIKEVNRKMVNGERL